ncbi:MAG: hypothetical protein JWM86_1614 [Thermoleophilia bacterium]|nr:hypothetical protein [Thermoleophilia bacterium]
MDYSTGMSSGGNEQGADAATLVQGRPGDEAAAAAHARDEAAIDEALGGTVEPAAEPARDDAPRTRDLLAEIADRLHDTPVRPELERRERSFVRWLLVTLVLAIVALYGVLWWLDPISVTGRQTRFSVVENGGVRQAKLDLMEELPEAPDVLVLGSSRSMKLNPAEIERVSGGATAFNGAVSGGTTQDMYLYARYADELWGEEEGEFPHLVIGVVSDVFRYTGTAALDPRLKRFMPKGATQERDQLEVAKQLLQLTTVKAAVRAVRRVVPRDGAGSLLEPEKGAGRIDASLATTGKQRGNQRENLDKRGMQLFNPGMEGDTRPLDKRVETQMRTFVQRSYVADAQFTGIDPRGLDLLRRTIKLANSHGDVPTIWVTPYAPEAEQYLPKDLYESRNRTYRAAIRELQGNSSLKFRFADFEDISAFGGTATDWHDGIHMTEKNTARVIAQLERDGLLTRPRP